MKLSEAIRLGAMLCKPSNDFYGCALGAALRSIGKHPYLAEKCNESAYVVALRYWPMLEEICLHPELNYGLRTMMDIIISLNDFNHWTRERIADWVAQIEQEMEAQAQPVEETQEVQP